MRTKIVEEEGKKFIIVQVDANMEEGFLSKTGKSFVQRIRGSYLKKNGEIIGSEGKLTGYISHPLNENIKPVGTGAKHYTKHDIIKYDFGNGMLLSAVKVLIP